MAKYESIKLSDEALEVVEKVRAKIKEIKKEQRDDSATFKNFVVNECVIRGGEEIIKDLQNE